MSYRKLSRDQHFKEPGPKRILALDGGGLRGILTLGFLGRVEKLLAERHGSDDFRLCHYYDLVAGTSTGAIIAAAVAKGMKVSQIVDQYLTIGEEVFKPRTFAFGVVRNRYDKAKLISQLKEVLGENTTLGSEELETGLLVMTKRMDTGSPWPLGNNPESRYFHGSSSGKTIPNKDFPLWQVVRASTAAPSFFDPETITISEKPGFEPVRGEFVDGGVSPFNNPALQALMYATLDGFRVRWPTGDERLSILSIGTGSPTPGVEPSFFAAKGAINALMGLMEDSAALVQTLMQWMSGQSRTARSIDRELGDLSGDLVAPQPLFHYTRYDLDLTREAVEPLQPGLSDEKIASLAKMDRPENLLLLRELGRLAAEQQVDEGRLPLPLRPAGLKPWHGDATGSGPTPS